MIKCCRERWRVEVYAKSFVPGFDSIELPSIIVRRKKRRTNRCETMTQIPDVTIRRGTLGDAALLSELGARTFSETFAADNTPEDLAAYVATSFNVAQQTSEL